MNVRTPSSAAPLWLLVVFAFGLILREAAPIFTWLTSAFLVFTLLDRPAQALKARGWPVALSALALVLLATAVLTGSLYVVGRLLTALMPELERARRVFMDVYESLNTYWSALNARVPTGDVGGTLLHGVGSVVSALTFALLVPVLAFFLLIERDALANVLGRAFRDEGDARQMWAKMTTATWAFFAGNLLLGVVTYPLFTLLLYFFDVPSVFITAALATVLNLVPFAGALLAGLLPAVALYAQTPAWPGALALYGCCLAIHVVVADVLTPKMLGARVNINATTSTIAMVAWGELWGGVGLLLAIPITSVIKIAFEHSDSFWLKWLAEAMSHQVDRSLEAERLTATPG